MNAFDVGQKVADIVTKNSSLSRVFDELEIDYCCDGQRTLEQACRQQGLDARAVLAELDQCDQPRPDAVWSVDPATMSLTDLANHIEQTHHAYLRAELPRLAAETAEVASAYDRRDVRLAHVRATLSAMAHELWCHMLKEEMCLFPKIRQLEASGESPAFHCDSVAGPVRQMELEHDEAGSALERLRELTDGFTPPEWACDRYRALLEALAYLERDLHWHIHKENNLLFPRALEMEAQRQRGLPVA
jgi:regulator of cell morphogenesis and NO signaling